MGVLFCDSLLVSQGRERLEAVDGSGDLTAGGPISTQEKLPSTHVEVTQPRSVANVLRMCSACAAHVHCTDGEEGPMSTARGGVHGGAEGNQGANSAF